MAAEPFHTLKEHLLRLGYQVSCFETAAEAADHLDRVIDQRDSWLWRIDDTGTDGPV